MIEARGLGVTLGGQRVLDAVSFTLAAGEVTVVLGPNGAGKSTLLACLAGLRAPDEGEALLDRRPVRGWAAAARAQAIGYLPQLGEIAWPVDVATLVGLGRLPHRGLSSRAADADAVARALAAVGLSALAGRDATTLSGGERARALLARALAGAPRWLLADEPLTGLDPGRQFDTVALLRAQAAAGLGVVVTLHDLPLAARIADRVLLIAEGRLVADGPPGEALTPARLAQVYGIEVRIAQRPEGIGIEVIGRAHG